MNLIRFYTVIRREIERFLRVPIQTLISPWISALLYIFIFGAVIGSRINFLENINYINFVLPGIVMMNIINSAFGQSSSSLYMHRFTRAIEEMLTAPLSYAEIIGGYIIGAIARSFVVSIGIFLLAIFFTTASISNLPLFLFFTFITASIFSLLGLLTGLFADRFEHLTILQTFLIQPLIYLGGVFNSIYMLPESMQAFTKINPFFYMVDGLRYSMIGYSESNLLIGAIMLTVTTLFFFILLVGLFKKGYKLRN
jgi:ABC-2 type transport system permease protein